MDQWLKGGHINKNSSTPAAGAELASYSQVLGGTNCTGPEQCYIWPVAMLQVPSAVKHISSVKAICVWDLHE